MLCVFGSARAGGPTSPSIALILIRIDVSIAAYASQFWHRSSASALVSGRGKIDVTTRDSSKPSRNGPLIDIRRRTRARSPAFWLTRSRISRTRSVDWPFGSGDPIVIDARHILDVAAHVMTRSTFATMAGTSNLGHAPEMSIPLSAIAATTPESERSAAIVPADAISTRSPTKRRKKASAI